MQPSILISLTQRITGLHWLLLVALLTPFNADQAATPAPKQVPLAQAIQQLNLYGEWQQGGVIRGWIEDSIQSLQLNAKAVKPHSSGHFILAFGRDAPTSDNQLSYRINNQRYQSSFALTRRSYATQRIDNLPENKVSVPEQQLNRIYSEYKASKQARQRFRAIDAFSETFMLPTTGVVTGVYGSQRILNGKPRQPHFGIDIAAPVGSLVVAPAAGFIELIDDDMYFSGGTLILNHGMGVSSSFLHLSKTLVKLGDFVEQGEPIALVGATGRVTGAHLDWRMNWYDIRFDPMLILPKQQRQLLLSYKP